MDDPRNLFAVLVQQGRHITESYLIMGQVLKTLKDNETWRQSVGDGGIDSWDDFLKQPEIGLSRLRADKMIKAYEVLIENGNFLLNDLYDIPLESLKHLVEQEVVTTELVAQASTLSSKDFKEVIAENKNIQERTYTYMVMRKCRQTGNMTKVHGIDSDIIKSTFNIND